MEALDALKSENEGLKNVIKNINSEKVALDCLYLDSIRNLVQLKKATILMDGHINELNQKVAELTASNSKMLAEMKAVVSEPVDGA